jgi:tetratricopeptide (TPR) repeat protein
MKTKIPIDGLNTLLERVESLLSNGESQEAVSLLSQIIDESQADNTILSYLLDTRASVYSRKKNWDLAIADTMRCISICPDNSNYYMSMGVYITWSHFYTDKFRIDENNEALIQSISYYKECLKRDPTNTTAWLNIIETYLFIMDWESALSNLGMCKPYLNMRENKLIWTWLTCLTLVLDGDTPDQEDRELLYDSSIHYKTTHDCQQIDDVLSELERIHFHPERVTQAKEIHQLYKERIGIK